MLGVQDYIQSSSCRRVWVHTKFSPSEIKVVSVWLHTYVMCISCWKDSNNIQEVHVWKHCNRSSVVRHTFRVHRYFHPPKQQPANRTPFHAKIPFYNQSNSQYLTDSAAAVVDTPSFRAWISHFTANNEKLGRNGRQNDGDWARMICSIWK